MRLSPHAKVVSVLSLPQVRDAQQVHVDYAGLAFDQRHTLKLSGVARRASLSGVVECYECANKTTAQSLSAEL